MPEGILIYYLQNQFKIIKSEATECILKAFKYKLNESLNFSLNLHSVPQSSLESIIFINKL